MKFYYPDCIALTVTKNCLPELIVVLKNLIWLKLNWIQLAIITDNEETKKYILCNKIAERFKIDCRVSCHNRNISYDSNRWGNYNPFMRLELFRLHYAKIFYLDLDIIIMKNPFDVSFDGNKVIAVKKNYYPHNYINLQYKPYIGPLGSLVTGIVENDENTYKKIKKLKYIRLSKIISKEEVKKAIVGGNNIIIFEVKDKLDNVFRLLDIALVELLTTEKIMPKRSFLIKKNSKSYFLIGSEFTSKTNEHFNAGVFWLTNTVASGIKKIINYQTNIAYFNKNKGNQEFFNRVFKNNISFVGDEYNLRVDNIFPNRTVDPKIVHFAGKRKPWTKSIPYNFYYLSRSEAKSLEYVDQLYETTLARF